MANECTLWTKDGNLIVNDKGELIMSRSCPCSPCVLVLKRTFVGEVYGYCNNDSLCNIRYTSAKYEVSLRKELDTYTAGTSEEIIGKCDKDSIQLKYKIYECVDSPTLRHVGTVTETKNQDVCGTKASAYTIGVKTVQSPYTLGTGEVWLSEPYTDYCADNNTCYEIAYTEFSCVGGSASEFIVRYWEDPETDTTISDEYNVYCGGAAERNEIIMSPPGESTYVKITLYSDGYEKFTESFELTDSGVRLDTFCELVDAPELTISVRVLSEELVEESKTEKLCAGSSKSFIGELTKGFSGSTSPKTHNTTVSSPEKTEKTATINVGDAPITLTCVELPSYQA